MNELSFVLAGTNCDSGATRLLAALDDGTGTASRRMTAEKLPDVERRVIDPIAVASLIVSVPAAVLAVMDIVDRIKQRRKAQSVIDTATQLKAEQQVETYILVGDGAPRSVAELDPDKLLDLVAEIAAGRPGS